MTSLANRLATKMNGCGNAILVLDLRGTQIEVSAAEARAIAASDGLAFDQLMALHDPRSSGSDAYMTIFNADGSQAGACGNGTRCVAWTLLRDGVRTALSLETAAGPLVCHRVGEAAFEVEMGRPRFGWRDIPLAHDAGDPGGIDLAYGPDRAPILRNPAVVDMGNPHAVFFVEDIAAYNLAVIGQALERHPIFPARANISLARVVAPDLIELRTWERGAGLTLACGSAACAAAVTAARKGLSRRRARVSLPGGDLDILWRESDDMVLMTGPAEFEFETRLDPALFAGLAA